MSDRQPPLPVAPARLARQVRSRACATAALASQAMRVTPRRIGAPPDPARFPA